MYLLQISINPGAPLGGSISQNFPGTFNGTVFTAVDGAARINDFGKDNYAGQFFYGIPGDETQVSIAWVSFDPPPRRYIIVVALTDFATQRLATGNTPPSSPRATRKAGAAK